MFKKSFIFSINGLDFNVFGIEEEIYPQEQLINTSSSRIRGQSNIFYPRLDVPSRNLTARFNKCLLDEPMDFLDLFLVDEGVIILSTIMPQMGNGNSTIHAS